MYVCMYIHICMYIYIYIYIYICEANFMRRMQARTCMHAVSRRRAPSCFTPPRSDLRRCPGLRARGIQYVSYSINHSCPGLRARGIQSCFTPPRSFLRRTAASPRAESIYIYIYTHVHIHIMCIYIYIYSLQAATL